MDTQDQKPSPHDELKQLKKYVFSSKPQNCDENELARKTNRIDALYKQLIDEVGTIYLVDQSEYLNDYLNSGHKIVNQKSTFLTCIHNIVSEYLELSPATEDKYIQTVIDQEIFSPNVRRVAEKLSKIGEINRAIKWYEAVFKLDSAGASLWMDYIKLIKQFDDHDRTTAAFEKAIANINDASWIQNNYGHYLYQQELYNEAEIQFVEVMKIQEKNKFNYSDYYGYAASMLDNIYTKSDRLIERVFNYDAKLTVNIDEDKTRQQLAEVVAQLG